MAKSSLKITETRDDLSTTCILNKSYVKMPVSACCYIPTSLPQEQAAKPNMASMVRIQVFSIMQQLRMVWLILAYD